MSRPNRSARALAVFLGGAGAAHFALPAFYDAMIPQALPGTPRAWTYGSGVAEIAIGAAVAVPATRRLGGLAAAGLFVAVLPANVKQAVDARAADSPAMQAGTLLRLPLQLPLVAWAVRVARAAR